jgi:hypothetical protein
MGTGKQGVSLSLPFQDGGSLQRPLLAELNIEPAVKEEVRRAPEPQGKTNRVGLELRGSKLTTGANVMRKVYLKN